MSGGTFHRPVAADTVAVTSRSVLRGWRDEDAEPFARINADPAVMRFSADRGRGQTATRCAPTPPARWRRFRTQMDDQGYGRFAVEHRGSARLLGFTGLGHHPVADEAPEIGWRLASAWWRQGLATEAADAARDLAFGTSATWTASGSWSGR